jgi:hypothetical protein
MTSMPINTKITGTMYWKIQDLVSLMKYSLRFVRRAPRCLKKVRRASSSSI